MSEWLASPSGAQEAAVLDGDQLHVRARGGPATLIQLPTVFPLDGEGFWLWAWVDEDRIYVSETAHMPGPEGPVDPVCSVVDLRTGALSTPRECISGSFYGLYDVQIHDGVVVALSAGEGHPGIQVYRWTPEGGRGEDVFPEINLYPFGPVDPRWVEGELVIYSPCRLDLETPCLDAEGEERDGMWFAWRWREGRWVRRIALMGGLR